MFFETDSNGKIMLCSNERLNNRMKQLKLPNNFNENEIYKYIVVGDEVILNNDYKQPEKPRTMEDRLAILEKYIDRFKKLLGVNE